MSFTVVFRITEDKNEILSLSDDDFFEYEEIEGYFCIRVNGEEIGQSPIVEESSSVQPFGDLLLLAWFELFGKALLLALKSGSCTMNYIDSPFFAISIFHDDGVLRIALIEHADQINNLMTTDYVRPKRIEWNEKISVVDAVNEYTRRSFEFLEMLKRFDERYERTRKYREIKENIDRLSDEPFPQSGTLKD